MQQPVSYASPRLHVKRSDENASSVVSAELLLSRSAVLSRIAHRAFAEGDLRIAILEGRVAVVDVKNEGAGDRTRTCTPLREEDFRYETKGRRINVYRSRRLASRFSP